MERWIQQTALIEVFKVSPVPKSLTVTDSEQGGKSFVLLSEASVRFACHQNRFDMPHPIPRG
jgi:hypothetical protein